MRMSASYWARSVEESLLPSESPIAKIFLALVPKYLSTMMPLFL